MSEDRAALHGCQGRPAPICPRLAEAEWIWLPVKLHGGIKYVFELGKV
jgi:hypothetical protein